METVRIYVILENVGSEYGTTVPSNISLSPYDKDCYYLDLVDSERYDTVIMEGEDDETNFLPYNAIIEEHGWYDPISKIFDFDEENPIFLNEKGYMRDEVTEAFKCQKYVEGHPVGDPYYETF